MKALGLLPSANWMWFIVGLVGAVLTATGSIVVAVYLGVVAGSFSFGIARWAAS